MSVMCYQQPAVKSCATCSGDRQRSLYCLPSHSPHSCGSTSMMPRTPGHGDAPMEAAWLQWRCLYMVGSLEANSNTTIIDHRKLPISAVERSEDGYDSGILLFCGFFFHFSRCLCYPPPLADPYFMLPLGAEAHSRTFPRLRSINTGIWGLEIALLDHN